MNRLVKRKAILTPLALWLFGLGTTLAGAQDFAVRGEIVYTMAGDAVADGVVVVRGGKIAAVGAASSVTAPAGLEVRTAKVVTPGLVDAHSTLGLSGIYNSNVGQVRDQDQLDTSAPIQPDLRAIDAYDAHEKLIAYARSLGVTTIHTGHGPGALISGQTMIAKTRGNTVEEATLVPAKMIAMTLGNGVSSAFSSPKTSAKGVAMLREVFLAAQQYRDKLAKAQAADDDDEDDDRDEKADKDEDDDDEDDDDRSASANAPDRDLSKEVLARVLDGTMMAMITAESADEIEAALRLQREFGFPLVLDGAAEAYLLLDEIKAGGVPVFLHAPMARVRNGSFETAQKLHEAGIPFAIETGFEGYVPKTRVLIYEAAIAAANGLSREDTLAAITIEPARLLGIDGRVGSLEVGKDGDLVLFDGDPFEYTAHVCAVVIEGEVVSDACL